MRGLRWPFYLFVLDSWSSSSADSDWSGGGGSFELQAPVWGDGASSSLLLIWMKHRTFGLIEPGMKNSILNTDIFNVIITNCNTFSAWAGPPCGAVQLEKWWLRLSPWRPVTAPPWADTGPWHWHQAAGRCRSKQDAGSVGSARTDRLEKSGRAWKKVVISWKKMDFTSSIFGTLHVSGNATLRSIALNKNNVDSTGDSLNFYYNNPGTYFTDNGYSSWIYIIIDIFL